jgi:hypothetical protein
MSLFQGINLKGDYISLNDLNPISQNYIRKFNGLVLIREKIVSDKRLTGTLWYKEEVVGFTVEDIPRKIKKKKETAIQSSINFSPNSTLPPDKGAYYIALDTTGNDFIAKGYVQFPNDPRKKFKSPGVVPRVGTDPNAYKMESSSGNLDFSGIRIHQGSSERSTEGCLILSRERKANGTLKTDLNINKALTQFIYNNNITRIVYIDEFSLSTQSIFKITGIAIDSSTLQPIPFPTVKYFPQYIPPINNEETPPDLIDMYKTDSISGEGNKKGEFSIEIPSVSEYLSVNGVNSSLIIPNSKLEVTISAPGYEIIETTPLKADGTFKSNLGVIKIPNVEIARREANLKINEINDEQLKLLQESRLEKQFIELQTEKLLSTIKGKLTPFIINQIADLGVPDPIGLLKKTKDFQNKAKRYEKREKRKMNKNNNEGLANEPLSNNEIV